MQKTNNGRLMLRNTIFLYLRMFVIMCINLIAVKLLLQALGETDFGIYNVVGGIVTMLTFLTSSMSSAAQRFFAYYIGSNDKLNFYKVFRVSLLTFMLIVFVILVLAETIGLWLVNTQLTIPESRIVSTSWVYQLSVLTFCINLSVVPFMAVIIASERMDFYAIVSMIDAILKLCIIYIIKGVSTDKMVLYAGLYMFISFTNLIAYFLFIKRKYRKLSFKPTWERNIFRQIFSYCSWYMFGSFATVTSNQGINILLNIFFNPVINAARGIAYQINSAVNMFVTSFYQAVRPQIIKRYAAGEMESMRGLVFKSTKLSFYLILLMSVPLLIWMHEILEFWLKNVPEYTILFARLVIITTMIDTLGYPLTTAVCANGNIKWFQILTGGIILINLPISYIFLKCNFPPQVTMYIAICISVIVHVVRIYFSKLIYNLDISEYSLLIMRIVVVSVISFLFPIVFYKIIPYEKEPIDILIGILLSLFYVTFIIFIIGMNREEKLILKNLLIKKFK